MLNTSRLHNDLAERYQDCCFVLADLLQQDYLTELTSAYPIDGFIPCLRNDGPKKHYSFGILDIVKNKSINEASRNYVSAIWFELVNHLLSADYQNRIAEITNLKLSETTVNISFYKYGYGDWVSPHIDNPDKLVTQIFYFNPVWSAEWGGYFNLLGSEEAQDIIHSIAPLSTHSVLISRTNSSWHMVTPVTNKSDFFRLSMQLEFIK
jgi:Rps23 Pro-64 3,4-dihydroxylase Tpa1-like proline 4-hydroxylase